MTDSVLALKYRSIFNVSIRILWYEYYSTLTKVLTNIIINRTQMAKKQTIPTSESIRNAYIQELLKRRTDVESFVSFSEVELVAFIRKYESANFSTITSALTTTSMTVYGTVLQSTGKWQLWTRKRN